MRTSLLPVLLLPLLISIGCRKTTPPPAAEDTLGNQAQSAANTTTTTPNTTSNKVRVVAYINVTSGCQEATVQLLNELAIKYYDLVDMEIVDFGSPQGAARWSNDGLDCMTILFNGSPVLRFPGADGQPTTVIFALPAGFSWEHEDLQRAFASMKAGTLEILTEEEARRELAPRSVSLKVAVVNTQGASELQINGAPVFTIRAKAAGKTAAERIAAAKKALDKWAATPIHPSQLTIAIMGKEPCIQAGEHEIIRVTAADVAAAHAQGARQLANQWLKGLKQATTAAVQAAETASPNPTPSHQ